MTDWEAAWDLAKGVLIQIIWAILKRLYNQPKLLLRAARLLFRAARWSVGASLAFLGGFILCIIPFAAWIFVLASAESPASVVQYSIAALIAAALYGFGGLVLFGTGLWFLSPSSRVGKFGKSLVLTHLLRRKMSNREDSADFAGRSSFGLWWSRLAFRLAKSGLVTRAAPLSQIV